MLSYISLKVYTNFGTLPKVGQLTMQVDWLKKSEEVVGPDYESKFSPKPFDDIYISVLYQ